MYIHVLLLSYLYVCTKSGFHIYIYIECYIGMCLNASTSLEVIGFYRPDFLWNIFQPFKYSPSKKIDWSWLTVTFPSNKWGRVLYCICSFEWIYSEQDHPLPHHTCPSVCFDQVWVCWPVCQEDFSALAFPELSPSWDFRARGPACLRFRPEGRFDRPRQIARCFA